MSRDASYEAHYQMELERRRQEDELLRSDPGYDQWLDQLNQQAKDQDDEIFRESRS